MSRRGGHAGSRASAAGGATACYVGGRRGDTRGSYTGTLWLRPPHRRKQDRGKAATSSAGESTHEVGDMIFTSHIC